MTIISEADINRLADELAEVATTPPLVSALLTMRQRPSEDEALSEARRIASLDFLKSCGVRPPPDFRITTRTFEPPELVPVADAGGASPIVAFDDGKLTVRYGGQVVCAQEK